jgi:tetratricopeptide (TPR) repeat protein
MLAALSSMNNRKFYSRVVIISTLFIAISSSAQSSVNDAKNLYMKGMAFQKAELYDSAISYFSQAIMLDSTYAEAWFQRGLAYDRKGDPNMALANYEVSHKMKPNPVALNNIGQFSAMHGQLLDAIGFYKQAIALDSNYAPGYLNLGAALYDRGEYKEACEMWRKAAQLNERIAIMANRYISELCTGE